MTDTSMEIPDDALEILQRTHVAAVITSGPDGPHVTQSPFHWDGSVLSVSGIAWAARSENVRRQSRVALLIRDSLDSAGLVVYGEATLLEGQAVKEATMRILQGTMDEEHAARHWSELASQDERVVIMVRPIRTQWVPAIKEV